MHFSFDFLLTQIEATVTAVKGFYSMSPKRWREIKQIAAVRHEKALVLQRFDGTRWLAHSKRAMAAFIHNYVYVIEHFEDASNPARKDVKQSTQQQLKGWRKRLLDTKFLLACFFYLDLLTELSTISDIFQR